MNRAELLTAGVFCHLRETAVHRKNGTCMLPESGERVEVALGSEHDVLDKREFSDVWHGWDDGRSSWDPSGSQWCFRSRTLTTNSTESRSMTTPLYTRNHQPARRISMNYVRWRGKETSRANDMNAPLLSPRQHKLPGICLPTTVA